MLESVSYIGRRFPLLWRTCRALRRSASDAASPRSAPMFSFRPYVPGFNVEPPAEPDVPGFRMNVDGSVRTDGTALGRSPSYIPVGWTPIADDYGNAEIALSNSAGQPAEAAKALVEGAYSLGPGFVNYARGMGRGVGTLRSAGSSTIYPGDGRHWTWDAIHCRKSGTERANSPRGGGEGLQNTADASVPPWRSSRCRSTPWLCRPTLVAAFCNVWRCLSRTREGR